MSNRILAIIPAREGSKGVPKKNRRLVNKKPLIQFTIDAASQSASITRTIVTTDDPEIVRIAEASRVEVVHRPADLARDDSEVIDAVRHVVQTVYPDGDPQLDAIILLQPTSPLRKAADIDNALKLFFIKNRNPVCSVVRCEDNHPARMYTVDENGNLRSLMPNLAGKRRQELPPVYHRNGAIYVFGMRELTIGRIICEEMTPYEMPKELSLNIDNEIDLITINAIMAQG
jgi:CMP-N,N'-diacetyllegionaminic acid synthase